MPKGSLTGSLSRFWEVLMVQSKGTSEPKSLARATTLLVLGEDENGKRKAAVFSTADMGVVFPAAKAMNLAVHQLYTEHLAKLTLPTGRIYARGKAFIPPVRKALYDELQTEIANAKSAAKQAQAERSTDALELRKGTDPMTKTQTPSQSPSPQVTTTNVFPPDWASVAAGHVVLIEEPGEGYWHAVVINREDELLTVRFRDYPKVPPVQRHISAIALLNPRVA
jgi:hypothetical protein